MTARFPGINERRAVIEGVNEFGRATPLLIQEGWSRMEPLLRTRSETLRQSQPPRLRLLRWLRIFFLMAQPPLL